MPLEEIVTALSMKLVSIAGSPSQVIFAVTMQDVIAEIARTYGENALDMSVRDLLAIKKEVRAAIDHGLDVRDYIHPGIETWEICKNL
jgi:hypothetical protein